MILASIDDYRRLARRRLPRFLFDYIDGGAFGEATLRANTADLQMISLRQRVLRDLSLKHPDPTAGMRDRPTTSTVKPLN